MYFNFLPSIRLPVYIGRGSFCLQIDFDFRRLKYRHGWLSCKSFLLSGHHLSTASIGLVGFSLRICLHVPPKRAS